MSRRLGSNAGYLRPVSVGKRIYIAIGRMFGKEFEYSFSLCRRIAAPAETVWKILSRPGHLAECHPFCERNPVDKWPGLGSRDTVCYHNGSVLHREVTKWDEGAGFTVDVFDNERNAKAKVSFMIQEQSAGALSELSVVVMMRGLEGWPEIIRRLVWILRLRPSLKRYFNCVLKGFEYYATTGKPVAKNQFGVHRDFSVP